MMHMCVTRKEIGNVIGRSKTRVDALEKVTGEAKYTTDIFLPRMLYGKILRSPYAHAKILSIDPSKALKIPGIKAVLTSKEVPRIPFSGTAFPGEWGIEDQYVLDEKVRFLGDAVVAVAAESEEIAEEGSEAIEVKYEKLPAVFDPVEAIKPNAPKIHETGNILTGQPMTIEFGNIDKGFREADHVFEDVYKTSVVNACSMEPHSCVASWDASANLTVWSSTQIPFRLQAMLSKIFQIPLIKINVIRPHVGGGFGNKDCISQELICAFLAQKTCRPVKMVYTREEEFYATTTRHPALVKLRTGVKDNGLFIAREANVIMSTGAYSFHGIAVLGVLRNSFIALYRCPNIKFEGFSVYTNTPSAGAMRGFGDPQLHFAMETQIDAICEELEMDPIEFRLKNLIRTGDTDPSTSFTLTSCGLEECMEEGMKRIGWNKKGLRRKAGIKKRGIGLAVGRHASGSKPFVPEVSGAFVKLNVDGTVNIITGASEIGQGLKTVLAQIGAEAIGASFEDIAIIDTNTASAPYDLGTYGSRDTFIVGGAVKAAAEDAKRKLLELAAKLLKVDSKVLDVKNGRVSVKGSPEKGMMVAEVLRSVSPLYSILGEAYYEPRGNAPAFAAQFAEVEVDTETGVIKVIKLVAAHDVGRAINPMLLEGQIEGGLMMGIGYSLCEEQLLNNETGMTLNPNFTDYKILTAHDMPEIVAIIVESIEPNGPFGAKGIGEMTCVPTAAAIANAVKDAAGIRIKELPMTPEKILNLLMEKRGKSASHSA